MLIPLLGALTMAPQSGQVQWCMVSAIFSKQIGFHVEQKFQALEMTLRGGHVNRTELIVVFPLDFKINQL
jgi:hypothetical protein